MISPLETVPGEGEKEGGGRGERQREQGGNRGWLNEERFRDTRQRGD